MTATATARYLDHNGTLEITCARGHVNTVVPAIWEPLPDGYVVAVFGSSADFCGGCEADPRYGEDDDFSASMDYEMPGTVTAAG